MQQIPHQKISARWVLTMSGELLENGVVEIQQGRIILRCIFARATLGSFSHVMGETTSHTLLPAASDLRCWGEPARSCGDRRR